MEEFALGKLMRLYLSIRTRNTRVRKSSLQARGELETLIAWVFICVISLLGGGEKKSVNINPDLTSYSLQMRITYCQLDPFS